MTLLLGLAVVYCATSVLAIPQPAPGFDALSLPLPRHVDSRSGSAERAITCSTTSAPVPFIDFTDNTTVNYLVCFTCVIGSKSLDYGSYVAVVDPQHPQQSAVLNSALAGQPSDLTFRTLSVGKNRALIWSRGDPRSFTVSVVPYKVKGHEATSNGWTHAVPDAKEWTNSAPSFSTRFNAVYLAMDSGVRSMDLDSGNINWEHSWNISTVEAISDVVYFEDEPQGSYVFWTVEVKGLPLSLYKAPAQGTSAQKDVATNPCGFPAASGEHFQLKFVNFGADKNGDLNGLFLYGNTGSNFVVCRISHHNISKVERTWLFSDAYTVFGLTGGDNATLFNAYNRGTRTYEVVILNQTVGVAPERSYILRGFDDRHNNPVVVYNTTTTGGNSSSSTVQQQQNHRDVGTGSPRILLQVSVVGQGLEVLAFDTWSPKVTGKYFYNPAWSLKVGCWANAAVATPMLGRGSDATATANSGPHVFCTDDERASSFNYAGTLLWEQMGVVSKFPPVVAPSQNTVAFLEEFSLVGFSFDAALPGPPAENPKLTRGERALLVLILVIFFLLGFGVLGHFVWKRKTQEKRRSLPPEVHNLNEEETIYGATSRAE